MAVLNVNVSGAQGIGLNELAARLNVIPHEHGENVIGFNSVVNLHAQQAAHSRVHGGFPQLSRVHFAQAFVALASGGVFSLHDQPAHGQAEIRNFFLLGPLTLTAHGTCTFGQQRFKSLSRLGQRRVVGAVNKILRDNAAFHIAVVAATDAQNRLVGTYVKFAGNDGVWQMRLQGGGRGYSGVQGVQIKRDAVRQ